MTVKPILFNTDMVRAILDGRKSCTRRLVKTRSKDACGFYVTKKSDGSFAGIYEYDENESMFDNPLMPPYQFGDILYVRETYTAWHLPHGEFLYLYKATSPNGDTRPTSAERDCEIEKRSWHPSIHMPKEAARIWLKVTNVKVERLQEITNNDVIKEGCEGVRCDHSNRDVYGCTDCMNTGWLEPPLLDFLLTWNSTIKKSDLDRYGWDANPWVWGFEFERCKKPE